MAHECIITVTAQGSVCLLCCILSVMDCGMKTTPKPLRRRKLPFIGMSPRTRRRLHQSSPRRTARPPLPLWSPLTLGHPSTRFTCRCGRQSSAPTREGGRALVAPRTFPDTPPCTPREVRGQRSWPQRAPYLFLTTLVYLNQWVLRVAPRAPLLCVSLPSHLELIKNTVGTVILRRSRRL